MPSLCNNPEFSMHIRLLIIILGYLVSYFLAMSMPIR